MLTFPLLEGLLKLPRFGRPLFCTHLFSTFSQTKGPPDPKSPLFVSPLYQFFEDGVPVPDANSEKFHTFGRSWSAAELRLKSFEDLHKLWFVCLKELNVLSTQETFASRRHVEWNGTSRILKTRLTMKRIRQVVRERKKMYEEAVGLWRRKKQGKPLELSQKEEDMAWALRKVNQVRQNTRSFRKFLRYRRKFLSLLPAMTLLWADKHRPSSLDELDMHPEVTTQLKAFARLGDIPHLLIYGPSGAGKRTRIISLLKTLYTPAAIEKLKIDNKSFDTPSGKTVELHTISSLYHVEMNPRHVDVGFYDRLVVQEMLRDFAQTQQISREAPREYKVAILNEADMLTKDAQHALRRTMEKYMTNLRIILFSSNLGKIIEPLQSRCVLVRVPAPEDEQVKSLLLHVCKQEGILNPSPSLIGEVVAYAQGNIRKALLSLEISLKSKNPNQIEITDWEALIENIAQSLIQEQTPARLLLVRAKFYELLSHCIPASLILKKLAFSLASRTEEFLKRQVCQDAAHYETRIVQGAKSIFHLEAFAAKFMYTFKQYLISMDTF
ncbi:Replication factor C (RF-C) subunit [Mitosporidium daphniae]